MFIIPIIVAVVICIICGIAGKTIVTNKGYPPEENHGFAWGFWLGVIGLIVCACKPSRNVVVNGVQINSSNSIQENTSQELLKYHQLLEEEIITQAEFDIVKQKLIKNL